MSNTSTCPTTLNLTLDGYWTVSSCYGDSFTCSILIPNSEYIVEYTGVGAYFYVVPFTNPSAIVQVPLVSPSVISYSDQIPNCFANVMNSRGSLVIQSNNLCGSASFNIICLSGPCRSPFLSSVPSFIEGQYTRSISCSKSYPYPSTCNQVFGSTIYNLNSISSSVVISNSQSQNLINAKITADYSIVGNNLNIPVACYMSFMSGTNTITYQVICGTSVNQWGMLLTIIH